MEADDLLCSRNARPEKALVERAQWETNQATLLGEKVSKLGRMWKEWPGALLARRTRTIRMCSFDARSERQPRPLPLREVWESWRGFVGRAQ